MATAHIGAAKGEIAKTVLMPGDPLRAKYIAENYLEDVKQFNAIRGMYGYTGRYKGQEVSVQASGMGMPSMGIYSHELFAFYEVEQIIRIGTIGSYQEELKLGDLVIAQGASTDSAYASQYQIPGYLAPLSSYELLEKAVAVTREKGIHFGVGNILSTDVFYNANDALNQQYKAMGIIGVEMESAALYLNAMYQKKKALAIFTVSDEIYSGRESSPEERQNSFTNMMQVALETAIR